MTHLAVSIPNGELVGYNAAKAKALVEKLTAFTAAGITCDIVVGNEPLASWYQRPETSPDPNLNPDPALTASQLTGYQRPETSPDPNLNLSDHPTDLAQNTHLNDYVINISIKSRICAGTEASTVVSSSRRMIWCVRPSPPTPKPIRQKLRSPSPSSWGSWPAPSRHLKGLSPPKIVTLSNS